MRYIFFTSLIVISIVVFQAPVGAASIPTMAAPAGLSLLELKVTGDEFLVLQNNSGSDISDLSSYWINAYNNVNPLAGGVSNSSQQLPVAALKIGQTLLLSAAPMQTCGASVAGKLSVSLGDTGGFLQLTRTSLSSNGSIVQTAGDLVNWSSGATGIIQNLPSSTKDPRAVYFRYLTGGGYAWQQADLDTTNFCQLTIVVAGGSGTPSAVTPLTLAASSPPATILGEVDSSIASEAAQLPASDLGLNAPQLSELLPNPVGTGNDATDEYIELYNPNPKPFDLSGFSLQAGLTTTHSYVFPAGTTLAPSSFRAFYGPETKLSLSNTSGLVSLLDPLGNVLSSTAAYEKAKDGAAWALASGTWYYTTEPTPGSANIVKQPITKKAAASKKKTSSAKAKTAKSGHATKLTSQTTAASSSFPADDKSNTVHTWVLALVGAGALLYGAYEYRRDITNRVYWLGTKLGFGGATGGKSTGPGSD